MRAILVLSMIALVACPDPTYAPPVEDAVEGQAPNAGDAAAGRPDATQLPFTTDASVVAGEGVAIAGTIAYAGSKTGRIRIDITKVQNNQPSLLAKTLELPALGTWAVELPKDFGTVRIVGFLDQTGDGPTPDDAAATLPDLVAVGTANVEGLLLELKDDPDPLVLAPAPPSPQPGDAGKPPQPQDPNAGGGVIVGGAGSPGGIAGETPGGSGPSAAPQATAPTAPAGGGAAR